MKTTLGDATEEDINHTRRVDHESHMKMANAKKKWLLDY